VVVFHPLRREQLERVLEIELGQVNSEFWRLPRGSSCPRDGSGPDFLLKEGTDQRYGARHSSAPIERHVVFHWQTCYPPSKSTWVTWFASLNKEARPLILSAKVKTWRSNAQGRTVVTARTAPRRAARLRTRWRDAFAGTCAAHVR